MGLKVACEDESCEGCHSWTVRDMKLHRGQNWYGTQFVNRRIKQYDHSKKDQREMGHDNVQRSEEYKFYQRHV